MNKVGTRKNGLPDCRFRFNRTLSAKEQRFWQRYGNYICVAILGAIAGMILTKSLWDASRPIPAVMIQPPKVEAMETPFCYDPITCIRDVGEELGVSNRDIMTLIRIGKCESGLRPEALGINTNRTVDRGIFQINSIHKGLTNADAFDFQKNIRYGYKLFLKQGTTPWNSSAKCWNK